METVKNDVILGRYYMLGVRQPGLYWTRVIPGPVDNVGREVSRVPFLILHGQAGSSDFVFLLEG